MRNVVLLSLSNMNFHTLTKMPVAECTGIFVWEGYTELNGANTVLHRNRSNTALYCGLANDSERNVL